METVVLPNEVLLGEVTRLLKEGHSVVLRTKGNSMQPFITGDHDSVELFAPECLKENDITLARLDSGAYVLHRVIGMDGDNITLMGDGNIRGTEHCKEEDICGVVKFIIRENGERTDCSAPSYCRKVMLWRRLLPVRRYLLYIYRKIKL